MKVMIKISGEILLNRDSLNRFVHDIHNASFSSFITIGGGNLMRGNRQNIVKRQIADQIGMMSTIINGLYLKNECDQEGVKSELVGSLNIPNICRAFDQNHTKQNKVLIFVGGIGHSYFSTDTAAVLRTIQTECDLLIKYTKVSGVYNKEGILQKNMTYQEIIQDRLEFMDLTAISLAQENKLKIRVGSFLQSSICDIVSSQTEFTDIS